MTTEINQIRTLVLSAEVVIPAKAGIQGDLTSRRHHFRNIHRLDSRFRGNDNKEEIYAACVVPNHRSTNRTHSVAPTGIRASLKS
jgi:hypothetical protein